MDGQTEDVIVVAQVEALCVLLSVIHHPHSSNMVHNLPGLSVKQVTPAVIASVTEMQSDRRHYETTMSQSTKQSIEGQNIAQ